MANVPNPYAPPGPQPGHVGSPMAQVGAPPPSTSGRTVQMALQMCMVPVHALFLLSATLQVVLLATGNYPGHEAGFASESERLANLTGTVIGLVIAFTWSAGGGAWAVVNAVGVYQHKSWAYASLRAYWIASIATCCCFPMGIGSLIHLTRASVRQAFGRAP